MRIQPRPAPRVVLGVLALLVSFAACSATWEQSTDRIERHDFVEVTLRLDEPPSGNPFTDVTLAAELSRAGSPPVKIEGFCDDPDGLIHRVRFLAREVGEHRYHVVARVGAMQSEHHGQFRVRTGRRPGPVRLDPDHPRHFLHEGSGRHFFWNSTTAYWLLGFTDDAVIRESLDRLARLGINRIRVALSGRTRDGGRWREPAIVPTDAFRFRLEPWPAARPADIEDPGYDVTRFNVDHFRKAERMLAHAARRGIQVSLIFHLDGRDPGVDPFGRARMGGPEESRYYRHAVARFAAFANVMWDVTNEWHLFRDEAWVERMGALIRRSDPYGHLLSVHGRDQFPFRRSPWVDYVLFQSWDEHGGYEFMLRNRREQTATGRPLPVINEEYGYEDHYPFPWGQARRWPARTADSRRRLAWEIAMAGGYQTTGERADIPGYGGWLTGRGNDSMTMLEGYRHLRTFFEGLPWWQLEPREDLLRLPPLPPSSVASARPPAAAPPIPVLRAEPMCLAHPGTRYVVYLPRGGSVTMDLAPAHYRGRWFNPRTGRFLRARDRISTSSAPAAAWTSPPAPDAEDWVLWLERTSASR